MGRVTQQPPAPPSVPAPSPEPVVPAKPHHVEEVKPIPQVEPPVAVHNLTETVVVKPPVPHVPVVIEIDPTTVPQVQVMATTHITVSPEYIASLPPITKAPDFPFVEMTTHIVVPSIVLPSVPEFKPSTPPVVIDHPPLRTGSPLPVEPPHYQFLTPTFTSDNKPAAVVEDVRTGEVLTVNIPEKLVFDMPPEQKIEIVKCGPPEIKITAPVDKECKPILPEPKKSVTPEPECLGRKLAPGDVVDGDVLPPSEKSWNPATKNKVVRWFDMQWKSDGNYELVNWCVFMTHMELELRRL